MLDKAKYGMLLAETLPSRITGEEENERFLSIIEKMIDKGSENFSPEEDRLFDLLTVLVEEFENRVYPIEELPPNEMLKQILADREMKQKDLLPVFGSEGVISEIVNGKRPITIETAKKLADFLELSSYRILV